MKFKSSSLWRSKQSVSPKMLTHDQPELIKILKHNEIQFVQKPAQIWAKQRKQTPEKLENYGDKTYLDFNQHHSLPLISYTMIEKL